jgi:uncharacterized LabA/DUF88 family protein
VERVAVYVDGFNLFFGIRSKNPKAVNFDVASYVRSRLGSNQRLASVRYYSAPVVGNPDAERAQKRYFAALRASKVEVILGRFQQKTIHCEHCGHSIPSFEEKMTDVNIAVDLLTDGLMDQFDVAILVSADSDLVPPIKKLARCAMDKKVVAYFPPNRSSKDLKRSSHAHFFIDPKELERFQLDLKK